MTDPAPCYQRSPDAVTREVAGETLVVPIRGHLADLQRIYALNPVGALVWGRLDRAADVLTLCRAVADEFDVGAEEAEPSVRAFLAQLEDAGLAGPIGGATADEAAPETHIAAAGP
jgi:hypothetical protein